MKLLAYFLLAMVSLTVACGDESGAVDPEGKGRGGSTQSTGGASSIATSTTTPLGGAAGQVSAAGSGSVLGCAAWPASKLMPRIGPFFYGGNPGPCSSEDYSDATSVAPFETTAFVYDEQGHLVDYANAEGTVTTTCAWSGDTLQSCTTDDQTRGSISVEKYVWSQGTLTVTQEVDGVLSELVDHYVLSDNGYPLSNRRLSASGTVSLDASYEYDGCRLVRRPTKDGSGAAMPSQSMTYAYDTDGHIIERGASPGLITLYDYSCWQ